jgi:hypothetical protein
MTLTRPLAGIAFTINHGCAYYAMQMLRMSAAAQIRTQMLGFTESVGAHRRGVEALILLWFCWQKGAGAQLLD